MGVKYEEKRKYIRLNTVFPVEFQFVNDNKEPISSMYEAFTRNICRGGMCIEIRSEKGREPFKLIPGETKIRLIVNIPPGVIPTRSYAVVKWYRRISEVILDAAVFGVEYIEIEPDSQTMIERHALWLHRRPKLLFIYFTFLFIIILLLMYIGMHSK